MGKKNENPSFDTNFLISAPYTKCFSRRFKNVQCDKDVVLNNNCQNLPKM